VVNYHNIAILLFTGPADISLPIRTFRYRYFLCREAWLLSRWSEWRYH